MRYGVIPACTHKFVLSEYFKENGCFSALKWPRRPARHCQCGNSERPLPTGFTPFSIPDIKNIGLLGHKHRHFEGKTAALLPEEVRCFLPFYPQYFIRFSMFSLIFGEKPSANSPFSPRHYLFRCAPPSFLPQKGPSHRWKGRQSVSSGF